VRWFSNKLLQQREARRARRFAGQGLPFDQRLGSTGDPINAVGSKDVSYFLKGRNSAFLHSYFLPAAGFDAPRFSLLRDVAMYEYWNRFWKMRELAALGTEHEAATQRLRSRGRMTQKALIGF